LRFSAVFVLATICATLGLSVAYLKVSRLSVPLDPTAEATVWDVEARIAFEGRGQPAKVALTLPDTPPGFALLDEDFVSRSYGLALRASERGIPRQAVWTVRRAAGGAAFARQHDFDDCGFGIAAQQGEIEVPGKGHHRNKAGKGGSIGHFGIPL
jgi:hypothetical protein